MIEFNLVKVKMPKTDSFSWKAQAKYYKGKCLEFALVALFAMQHYKPYPSYRLTNARELDLVCLDSRLKRLEIIDVKNRNKKYGIDDAEDFASRVDRLMKDMKKAFPDVSGSWEIKNSIYSATGITPNALRYLQKRFGDKLELVCGNDLRLVLKKWSLSI